jgi:hypothetical protein
MKMRKCLNFFNNKNVTIEVIWVEMGMNTFCVKPSMPSFGQVTSPVRSSIAGKPFGTNHFQPIAGPIGIELIHCSFNLRGFLLQTPSMSTSDILLGFDIKSNCKGLKE